MWHETSTLPQMQQVKRTKPVQQIKTSVVYVVHQLRKYKNWRYAKMKFPTFLKVYGDQSFRGDCAKEDAELSTFVNQVRKKYPDTYGAVIVHIKNEGKRTALQAKVDRMHGQTKGASDILIPASRSLVLEMKRKDHTKSGWETGQQEYLKAAHDLGAFACVALGWEAAFAALEDWIKETTQ